MSSLKLIVKYDGYMEYIIHMLGYIPRTEKFNIGNEFKCVMYSMVENIFYLNKCSNKIYYCNLIDSQINIQRVYIRICYRSKYIDFKKYSTSIKLLDEIGLMLGGYIKSIGVDYGKKV